MAISATFVPAFAFAEVPVEGLSDAYVIVSALDANTVVVKDRSEYLSCSLSKKDVWVDLTSCVPIRTAEQHERYLAGEAAASLRERFTLTTEGDRIAAFISVFDEMPCATRLGRDPDYERVVFEVDSNTFDDLPPRQMGLLGPDDWDARERVVGAYGFKLGFSEGEIRMLNDKIYHQFNWLIQDSIEHQVISQVDLGLFKLNGKCD